MYYEYWGLSRPPFDNVPDPMMYTDCHASMENAIAETLFAIEEGDECIAVIVGDVGLGKTLSLRIIMDSLDPEKYRIVLVTNPSVTFVQLLREIIGQLTGKQCAETKKVDLLETFNRIIFSTFESGKKVLLIIDEANAIPPANLERLRLLTNMQSDRHNLFTMVLAGQLELAKRLEHPKRANLFQRIGTYNRITKIESAEKVKSYVEARLKYAGAAKTVFTDDAFDLLWEYSEYGVPRLINKIAKLSLKAGETNDFSVIDGDIVRQIGERFLRKGGASVPVKQIGTEADVLSREKMREEPAVEEDDGKAKETSPPLETQEDADLSPEESSPEAASIGIEIPAQVIEQARELSYKHRIKLAGSLAAKIMKENPFLTASHVTDPVQVWDEIRGAVLSRLLKECGEDCHDKENSMSKSGASYLNIKKNSFRMNA